MTVASGQTSVGRLAPSPTGALHLGNARTFLLAWLSIRSQGGTLLLRVEDIDGPRVKTDAVAQTLADLRWLGLDWDGEPVLQSERLARYEAAAATLLASGAAYPCVCSRREVELAASAPHAGDEGPAYPGTCRGRVDVDEVPFDDGCLGPQPGAVHGDFVIQKRDGGPAYQLAVVVDDAAQGVTEVVRADDLLPSTPRQLLLYRALGLRPPHFVHLPLVVGADGRRLAKRHGDTSIGHLRASGVTAPAVVGYLAWLSGLGPAGARCHARDLVADFDLDRVPRQPVRGDAHGLFGGEPPSAR
jgi:glutamyl-tRNA synthetase